MSQRPACNACGSDELDEQSLADLPIPRDYVPLDERAHTYPLILARCARCLLIQTVRTVPRGLVAPTTDRVTVRTSPRLLAAEHEAAELMALGPERQARTVLVAAATDGYRLRPYVANGWSGIGLEPARSRGVVGTMSGLRLLPREFDTDVVAELLEAPVRVSVLLLNDLLARAEDPGDVLLAAGRLVQDEGVAVARLPDPLACLLSDQLWAFDHEILSWFTLRSIRVLASRLGLDIVHVDEVAGAVSPELRVHLSRAGAPDRSVFERLVAEDAMMASAWSTPLASRLERWRTQTERGLRAEVARGGPVIILGASRGVSGFLTLAGIGQDLVESVADINPFKRDLLVPGTDVPIRPLRRLPRLRTGDSAILVIGPRLADHSREMQAQLRDDGKRVLLESPTSLSTA